MRLLSVVMMEVKWRGHIYNESCSRCLQRSCAIVKVL